MVASYDWSGVILIWKISDPKEKFSIEVEVLKKCKIFILVSISDFAYGAFRLRW
jgi:hypothetical protein